MPECQSLGLNYLRNDVESLVFSPSIRLWSNKVNLSGSVGLEKNNLDDLRNIDQNRIISSLNFNLRPNHQQNLNLQYSNFSFDQTVQFDSLITNSIVIKQVSKIYSGSYNYNLLSQDYSNVVSLSLSLQDANNISTEVISNQTLAALFNYTKVNIKKNSSFNVGVNYFKVSFLESNVKQAGVNLGYSLRSDKNLISIQAGSLVDIDKSDLNSHLSLRYKKSLSEVVDLELSTRARYNQKSEKDNRFILRSDVRIVTRL